MWCEMKMNDDGEGTKKRERENEMRNVRDKIAPDLIRKTTTPQYYFFKNYYKNYLHTFPVLKVEITRLASPPTPKPPVP